jgi:hypothetical protein
MSERPSTTPARTHKHQWLYGPMPPAPKPAPGAEAGLNKESPSSSPRSRRLPTAFPQATPRFATLSELHSHRKNKRGVHKSYDLDQGGGVSQREYFIASKFDYNKDGELQPAELQKAQTAIARGFGSDDFRDYFSFKNLDHTRFDRVLQKTCLMGKTSYEDTFNRVVTEFNSRDGVQSTPAQPPPNTRAYLLARRRAATSHRAHRPAGADSRHPELCEKRGAAPEATAAMVAETTAKTEAEQAEGRGQDAPAPKLRLRAGFVESPRHPTVKSLRQERRERSVPHSSYDLDGDGVVAPRDYFLARKFDRDKKHSLSDSERQAALEAVAAGMGKDSMERYFSAGQSPLSRHDKVLLKTFQVKPTNLRHTHDRVIGDFNVRDDFLGTQLWGSTTHEAMKMPFNRTADGSDGALSARGASSLLSSSPSVWAGAAGTRAPRLSGGWAGIPSVATPRGHWCHRTSQNVKFKWKDAAAAT